MLIDTHAHVNFRAFKDDANEVLQRAIDSGVQVVTVGSQIDTSRQGVELANQFESGVYAVVGLHPEHTHSQYVDEEETHFKTREETFAYDVYKELALNPKVVGIGECGLDYYRLPANVDSNIIKEKQKAAFRSQIKLAKELDKTLVIHSRPAKDNEELFNDLLQILDEELVSTTPAVSQPPLLFQEGSAPQLSEDEMRSSPPNIGGVRREASGGGMRFELHSYTGSPEYAQKFLDRGAYISFNGITTFDKTGNMEKLVKLVPLDRLILETDCPYLTPVPHRGKRNEPSFVKFTAEKVAQIKGVSVEEISEITTKNARVLFKI